LTFLDETLGDWLLTNRKQIAVITYTNAACDEISRRLHYKSIFSVSTIHSFLWELIKNYQSDIKAWVINSINLEIAELEEKQRKSKTGKTSEKRAEDIRKKQERLAKINTVRRFTYNPNGDNVGYDSLNHSEVVKMGSKFICAEDTMQNILISQYPILLIDESQDTKKELVDAIFTVCERHKGKFIVGMFGDTMQRIYQDGKENLSQCIPDDWVKPQKIMNHRSASRIVTLANAIRFTVDTQQQRPRSDAAHLRLPELPRHVRHPASARQHRHRGRRHQRPSRRTERSGFDRRRRKLASGSRLSLLADRQGSPEARRLSFEGNVRRGLLRQQAEVLDLPASRMVRRQRHGRERLLLRPAAEDQPEARLRRLLHDHVVQRHARQQDQGLLLLGHESDAFHPERQARPPLDGQPRLARRRRLVPDGDLDLLGSSGHEARGRQDRGLLPSRRAHL
ncbi:MAG: hypothetical protein EGQ11_01060, partial [Sutterella sp.]|nr:hypothetical protein [Sutterella sp.]